MIVPTKSDGNELTTVKRCRIIFVSPYGARQSAFQSGSRWLPIPALLAATLRGTLRGLNFARVVSAAGFETLLDAGSQILGVNFGKLTNTT